MSLKCVMHTDNMLAQFSLVSYPDPLPQRKGSGYETRFSSAITKAVSRTQTPSTSGKEWMVQKYTEVCREANSKVYRGMS